MSPSSPKPPSGHHDPQIKAVLDQLDQDSRSLDAATASRLNQARQRALQEVRSGRAAWQGWRLPAALAGGLASVTLAVLLWQAWPGAGQSPTLPSAMDTNHALAQLDLALLSEQDSLEFYQDLEFYQWLDTELDPQLDADLEAIIGQG